MWWLAMETGLWESLEELRWAVTWLHWTKSAIGSLADCCLIKKYENMFLWRSQVATPGKQTLLSGLCSAPALSPDAPSRISDGYSSRSLHVFEPMCRIEGKLCPARHSFMSLMRFSLLFCTHTLFTSRSVSGTDFAITLLFLCDSLNNLSYEWVIHSVISSMSVGLNILLS